MSLTIETLDDLVDFSIELANGRPEPVAERIRLETPGLDSVGISQLVETFPGLPDEYLACVSSVHFWNVELGGFFLGFGAARAITLLERLKDRNSPQLNPFWQYLSDRQLIQVASLESDPIAVRHCESERSPGAVVWIDITSGEPILTPLAPDFRSFLITAGRLEQGLSIGAGLPEIHGDFVTGALEREGWSAIASMLE